MFLFVGLCVAHAFQAFVRSLLFFEMKYLARYWQIFSWQCIIPFRMNCMKYILWTNDQHRLVCHVIQNILYPIVWNCQVLIEWRYRFSITFHSFSLSCKEVVQNWFMAERIMRTFVSRNIFTFCFLEKTKIKEKTTVNTFINAAQRNAQL